MKTTHCDYDKWALEILELVRVLHFRGFQRLRVCAGSSPSGNNWHIALTPASNILCSNGAKMADFGKAVYHSTADSSDLFGWHDIDDRSPVGLADRLMDEWPELCATARGRDWDYVGWFAEMLRFAREGLLPASFENWGNLPEVLSPTKHADVTSPRLPRPPGGERKRTDIVMPTNQDFAANKAGEGRCWGFS